MITLAPPPALEVTPRNVRLKAWMITAENIHQLGEMCRGYSFTDDAPALYLAVPTGRLATGSTCQEAHEFGGVGDYLMRGVTGHWFIRTAAQFAYDYELTA